MFLSFCRCQATTGLKFPFKKPFDKPFVLIHASLSSHFHFSLSGSLSSFLSMLCLPQQTGRKPLGNVLTWNRRNRILPLGNCPTATSLNLHINPTGRSSRCPLWPATGPLPRPWAPQRDRKPRRILRRSLTVASAVRPSAPSPTSTSTSTESTRPGRPRRPRGVQGRA